MICPECKNRNPIGNKFCRECGAKLSPATALDAEEAAKVSAERTDERVADLLARAFALAEQKRPNEALPLAQEAAELLPGATSAHALLASLYEQTEQHDKAIAAMERVVALNPDSRADQEKLEQMRRGVHVLPARPHTGTNVGPALGGVPRRRALPPWFPVALAGATAVVVVSAGLSLLNRGPAPTAPPPTNRRLVRIDPSAAPGSPNNPNLPAGAFAGANGSPSVPQVAEVTPSPAPLPAATGRTDPFAPANGVAPPAPARGRAFAALPAGGASLPVLPRRSSNGVVAAVPPNRSRQPQRATTTAIVPAPVVPSTTSGGRNERFAVRPPSGSGNFGNGSAAAAPTVSDANTAPVATAGRSDGGSSNGYIRIQVGPPQGAPAAPAAPPPVISPPPVAAPPPPPAPQPDPMLRAQTLQAAGRYAEAVSAYQQALGSNALRGAARGDAYQGMAAAYQRMNSPVQARTAYRQALGAYQAAQGGPDASAARQGIATCRAALEFLGDA